MKWYQNHNDIVLPLAKNFGYLLLTGMVGFRQPVHPPFFPSSSKSMAPPRQFLQAQVGAERAAALLHTAKLLCLGQDRGCSYALRSPTQISQARAAQPLPLPLSHAPTPSGAIPNHLFEFLSQKGYPEPRLVARQGPGEEATLPPLSLPSPPPDPVKGAPPPPPPEAFVKAEVWEASPPLVYKPQHTPINLHCMR